MILVILCNTSMLYITECAENMLTLQDIRTLAIENSTGLQNTKIDLVKKQIELRQAKEGMADIIKKESTIRFSLLFNIKFPEKHGMPKEIELLTKIPEIENDIKVLNEKKNSEALKSQTTAEQAYYDVLFAQYQQQKTIDRLEQLEQSQYVIDKQVKLGKAKQSDLEYIQDSIDSLQKQSERNILTLYEKQTKLASLLGKENLLYDTVSEELQQTSFQRNQLNDITNYALEHDFELYQKRQSRILAEKETDVVMGIYKNVYSKYISDVESYIKNHKNIDYEEFIARYQYTLYNIDSPWYGSYVINLIFFKIYIPKEWFKGEYSGTRYMEDEKYQLFITLVERDKAIEEEKQTEKQLKQNIETAYSTLKTMESSIKQMEQNLQQNEIRYQKKLEENKKGFISFVELESARESLYQQQQLLYESKVDYAKSLSAFNAQTAGYVNYFLNIVQTQQYDYEMGDSNMETAMWHIKTDITNYNFLFSVSVPEEYDVDSYQLYYEQNAVGEKTPISETLTHLSIAYGNTTMLTVNFYKQNELKYTADIEGVSYDGVLHMKKAYGKVAPEKQQQYEKGSWNIKQLDNLRDTFYIETEQYHYDAYDLIANNIVIGTAKKGEAITALHLYFEPISNLQLRLKKENKELVKLYLDENGVLLLK